ncbi:MAG: ABC-F family ATP-binding cassette domain-containing protein [Chitinophagales bacterium]|nr:ABC-F family ATP-binding cassette domain-containing protein [Chitinophagales bacterium]
MNILTVKGLTKYYGSKLLFEDITFFVEQGQKVALIAKNGTGKTTLLKIMKGEEPAESGTVEFNKNFRVGFLGQNPEFNPEMTIMEVILSSKNPLLETVMQYEDALEGIGSLEDAIEKMDFQQAWDYETKVKTILTQFKLSDYHKKTKVLSGGEKKRLALSILLLDEPDMLILDEPTNHLDLDMIEWLEDYLSGRNLTLFLITHDRYFLENICNEILELEGGKLYRHKGNYSNFLENKSIREETSKSSVEKAQNLLRKELDWIRRQPKARTTKAKSRVDAFDVLQEKATQKTGDDKLELQLRMSRMGGKILEMYNVQKAYDKQVIVRNFSYKFKRGERVGVVGNNGMGKSTFLNMIAGLEKYDAGNIITGETIVFGYYTQEGMQLKGDKRVIEVVKDIAEVIPTEKGFITAAQMLERFLFQSEHQYAYVSTLSGGEKKRLYLLTILMKNPNFLILDEPTNDLDILTLNALEDFLDEYKGCLMIVTHDRYMLDKMADHLFVFEGNGEIKDFNGTYREYRTALAEEKSNKRKEDKLEKPKETKPAPIEETKKKLSFKEQKEMQDIEQEITALEQEKASIETVFQDANISHEEIQSKSNRLGEIIALLEEKELRWLELSERS